ncbi:MAG TPA: hypothetical protein VFG33_15030 [Kribbella sp.]|uniref:hypothetical protein n=1 Tax=Kribbella sp. TaxID=1871183 RepID=UPI002D78D93F|nr:hypothetical protein [Kribbella sp.]HET6294695.1 hypothetical protein [Kribbella sp.]
MADQQEFKFHGPASGVFGNQRRVTKNNFNQGADPLEAINAVLSQLDIVLDRIDGPDSYELRLAANELRSSDTDRNTRKNVLERIARIATAAGNALSPLLKVTKEALELMP